MTQPLLDFIRNTLSAKYRLMALAITTRLNEWVEPVKINNDTKIFICKRVNELTSLSTCRQYAKPSEFVVRGNGFWAICKNCNLEWGINHIKDKRIAQLSVSDVTERSFKRYGSWCIDTPI